jgi:hypothetical protein
MKAALLLGHENFGGLTLRDKRGIGKRTTSAIEIKFKWRMSL